MLIKLFFKAGKLQKFKEPFYIQKMQKFNLRVFKKYKIFLLIWDLICLISLIRNYTLKKLI